HRLGGANYKARVDLRSACYSGKGTTTEHKRQLRWPLTPTTQRPALFSCASSVLVSSLKERIDCDSLCAFSRASKSSPAICKAARMAALFDSTTVPDAITWRMARST